LGEKSGKVRTSQNLLRVIGKEGLGASLNRVGPRDMVTQEGGKERKRASTRR